MRYKARRYVLSILIMLLVGVAYAQTQVETENVLTTDSQAGIQPVENINGLIKAEDSLTTVGTVEAAAEAPKAAPAKEALASADSRLRNFRATAYCLRGRTASGQKVRRGLVAADPRVLPLGTTIEITTGRYSGTYLVADTGSRVRGSKLDIWVPSCSEARRWGNRTVKVRVIKKKNRKRR